MAEKDFLNDVYGLDSVESTKAFYDAWSGGYDQEVGGKGYATPARIAAALAGFVPDKDCEILDFGCGTGMSGAALRRAGFSTIDGCDLSGEMLAQARAKNAYRRLWQADSGTAFDVTPGDYQVITAVGVISIGAAPRETMDQLIGALAPGGLLAFSFNDRTLEDPRFKARVASYIDRMICTRLLREEGAHLPGIDLRSTIFILQRL